MVASKRTPKTPPRARPSKAANRTRPRKESKAAATASVEPGDQPRGWTFLTNHAHVLLCLARGSLTARELSLLIGITERSVQAILADLVADGYLDKTKVGRRNSYAVNPSGRLRHPLESAHTVGELISALT
ncbi:transcriptional regulator [Mycolicibacterium aurum]|uniref:Transcriptional regulator n=1 Tax=Mycolicibacterium aurum TaxID=1791 RepID=A0A3S4RRB7_MYCAU|nr:winged helix-turn-helix domain-containing protein [Mycolicibacterium aurum]VEG56682.1 transcriptional regulator [Mycolicibacterium aurum]